MRTVESRFLRGKELGLLHAAATRLVSAAPLLLTHRKLHICLGAQVNSGPYPAYLVELRSACLNNKAKRGFVDTMRYFRQLCDMLLSGDYRGLSWTHSDYSKDSMHSVFSQ